MYKRKSDVNEGRIVKRPNVVGEDGALKYNFMTSLQNIVMAKVVNIIWMNQNTKEDLEKLFKGGVNFNLYDNNYEQRFHQIKNDIILKISDLSLPKSISEALKNVAPHVGNSILKFFEYIHLIIFENRHFSMYTAVNVFSNLSFTPRGYVDYAETAMKMIHNQDCRLSDDHKYKLACACCLENEIFATAPGVVDNSYLQNVNKDLHPMVYFWTSHITSSNISYSHGNINDIVMHLLLMHPFVNEIPLKYMWDKLNEAEKARNLIPLIEQLDNQEFFYSLLSNLDYEQQQGVFKELTPSMLVTLFMSTHNNWLWADYFLPTVCHILKNIEASTFYKLIRIILLKINVDCTGSEMCCRYELIFKQVWKEASTYLHFFNYEEKLKEVSILVFSFSWEQHMDIVQLLIEALNMQEKKHILFGTVSITHSACLIENDRWDLVELFIKYTISSDEDRRLLKQTLFNSFGKGIAAKFLRQEKYENVEYFLKWILQTEEEIKLCRQSLAYGDYMPTEFSSILNKNKADFTKLENRFKWCAEGDLEKINEYKANISELGCCKILIRKLLLEKKYDMFDQVLNWCFLNNQQKIMQYKSSIPKRLIADYNSG